MQRKEKEALVANLHEKFKEVKAAILTDFTGLNVEQITHLRRTLKKSAAEYTVVKNTLLRRASRSGSSSNGREPILTYDNLVFDFDKHEVTVDGKRVDLSPTEFRLLSVLARHRGRVLPHEFLLTEVWGPEYVGEVDYLRLYISYLRRKIERDPSNPSLIHNEWGVGYRFG